MIKQLLKENTTKEIFIMMQNTVYYEMTIQFLERLQTFYASGRVSLLNLDSLKLSTPCGHLVQSMNDPLLK